MLPQPGQQLLFGSNDWGTKHPLAFLAHRLFEGSATPHLDFNLLEVNGTFDPDTWAVVHFSFYACITLVGRYLSLSNVYFVLFLFHLFRKSFISIFSLHQHSITMLTNSAWQLPAWWGIISFAVPSLRSLKKDEAGFRFLHSNVWSRKIQYRSKPNAQCHFLS